MFDFEKLDVYQEIKNLNAIVIAFIFTEVKDEYISKQYGR
jgi:hypothetical protein